MYLRRVRRFFFWLLPAWVALGACRQDDDIVAKLKSPDAAAPPIEDATIPPVVDVSVVDVSVERDAPPITIDREVPQPDAVVIDNVVPPPPMDASSGCAATGPIISVRRVNNMSSEECAGQLAAHTFTHALCACEDLNFSALLSTGSFDSSAVDKTTVVTAGAAVGIAGNYPSAASLIGGSLTVAGVARSPLGIEVHGDLRLAGSATFSNYLTVKRDAWFVSRVGYLAYSVTIARNLHMGFVGGLQGLGPPPMIGGTQTTETFAVADPCACAEHLDVAAMEMDGAAGPTDNAPGTEPTVLTNVTSDVKLKLSCGRFKFDSIGGTGAIQLTIDGRTAIFVDGNVNASDSFQLVMAPAAELDWFIRGNLSIGAAKIGDPNRPSATRIYVAGSDDIALSSAQIGANLYAPTSNVSIGPAGVAGSVYGKSLSVPGGAFIRYDRAILNQGNKCEPTVGCDKCHTCNGGTACVKGACGACATDDDCCAPLVCDQGSCQPLLHF